jgi:hypothetical protein
MNSYRNNLVGMRMRSIQSLIVTYIVLGLFVELIFHVPGLGGTSAMHNHSLDGGFISVVFSSLLWPLTLGLAQFSCTGQSLLRCDSLILIAILAGICTLVAAVRIDKDGMGAWDVHRGRLMVPASVFAISVVLLALLIAASIGIPILELK